MNTQTTTPTLKIVKAPGKMIDTQQAANALGLHWQKLNKLRSSGGFVDPDAKLNTGAYLYKPATVRRWAKENGHPFNL